MRNCVHYCLAVFVMAGAARAQAPPGSNELDSLPLEQLMDLRVRTATLQKQSLQDAPASMTVITADEIRRYGYRTLAEALSNVRGFYRTSDGPFDYVGARGFSLLGDFNTRFLVLINGHHMTDNVYGAMYYFGQDFPLDMDVVDQIEIVRGPSSALYGSNGLFATVNIITKTPENAPRARVATEVGTFGEQKQNLLAVFPTGAHGSVLLSGTVFHTGGRTVEFPERSGLSPSAANHVGSIAGYHLFADLRWRNWTVTALFGQSKDIVPSGWYSTEFGNTGTTDAESRNFVEAAWNHPVGPNGAVRWRTYYDQYRYDGIYDYGSGYRNFDGAAGDWAGSQLVYQYDLGRIGTLTVGGEANVDVRNLQYNYDVNGPFGPGRYDYFRISHPRTAYGIFAQQEFKLTPRWTAYLGGRVDDTTYDPVTFSPRAALVHKLRHSSYKLMYGRAFRNPSTFERYWEPNLSLEAERIDTLEIAREQNIGGKVNLLTSAFHYRLNGLIVGVPIREDVLQYQNAAKANATGFEAEINGRPARWLETSASFSLQRTRGVDAQARLQNSPVRLVQFRASVPLARQRLVLSGAVRYVGSRLTAYTEALPAMTLVDTTLTAPRLHPSLTLQVGVRNLFNTAYSDPLSPEHSTHLMPGPGRSMYARLVWRYD